MNDSRDLAYQNLLRTVPTLTEALERCHLLGGFKPEEAVYRLNCCLDQGQKKIGYCHFARMLNPNDSSHFNPDLIVTAMEAWGNPFPRDWLNHRTGVVAYPLQFMQILEEIRKALSDDGRVARFALSPDSGGPKGCGPTLADNLQRLLESIR